MVSCTRSSASAALPVRRRATRYRASKCTKASRSKLCRFSSTGVPGGGGGGGGGGGAVGSGIVPGSFPWTPEFRNGVIGFARRGAQHPSARRPRSRQEPRHAGRRRVDRIRRGAAEQALGAVAHGGHAARAV